ncbi:HNH endonuclease [bacterium]|nr:MAG: HNH endonuclease [bacterium]
MAPHSGLTDDALDARLKELAATERNAQAEQLALLAEFDVRGLPEAAGYPGLYDYCVKDLGLSEGAAYERVRAARATTRWPQVAEDFRAGKLSLAAVCVLAPLLNDDTAEELLAEARGLGRREAEELAASLYPTADGEDAVEPAPTGRRERERIRALSAERVQFAFTGSTELRRDIERARGLLWHKDPSGRLEAVVGALADFYLDREDPDRRLGRAVRAPAAERPAPANSRLVPQEVKDEVWLRDGGRCAYVSPEGRRCEAGAGLEYDHIVPWVFGGRSDSAVNIRLLCRMHNKAAARGAELGEG